MEDILVEIRVRNVFHEGDERHFSGDAGEKCLS